jgi:hypothetical protein
MQSQVPWEENLGKRQQALVEARAEAQVAYLHHHLRMHLRTEQRRPRETIQLLGKEVRDKSILYFGGAELT